jgi:hypothetical protein
MTAATHQQASQWGLYYSTGLTPNTPMVYANPAVMLDNWQWNQMVTLNAWHKLTITYDPAGIPAITRVYIEGVQTPRACSTSAPIYDPNTPWTLTLGNFDGDIDEVRISNTIRVNPQPNCP